MSCSPDVPERGTGPVGAAMLKTMAVLEAQGVQTIAIGAGVALASGLAAACANPTTIGELPPLAASGSSTASGPTTTQSVSSGPTPTSTGAATTVGPISTDPASTSTGIIGPGPQMSFAILFGEIPEPGTTGMSDVAGSGDGPADDAMLVKITTGMASCDEPFGGLQCGGAWWVDFTLPVDLQTPGTYNLFPDLNASTGFTLEDNGDGECGGGFGSLDGTLVLDVVNAELIAGRIMDTDAIDFDANVEFQAMRCP